MRVRRQLGLCGVVLLAVGGWPSVSHGQEPTPNVPASTPTPAPSPAPTPSPTPPPNGARLADDSDRLQVDAFLGEVLNNFSASAVQKYVNPEATKEGSKIQRLAGLSLEYRLSGKPAERGLRISILAAHGARTVEVKCAETKLSPCPASASAPSAPADEFYAIVRDSSTLEWYLGLRWVMPIHGGETWLYPKVQAGFVRAADASDDVIDNHFAGFGVEHRRGAFAYSHLELGWGRTDFFGEKRSRRFKADALLSYTPGLARSSQTPKEGEAPREGVAGFFIKGRLDSDLGPSSDDITIFAGIRLDVGLVMARLGPR